VARIRTIKPEFFTSEDIVSLTPLARLFYVSLWCEADREGRFEWKPRTLKMRYLPADDCDISALCQELIDGGMVVLYEADGRTYAHIPGFTRHQVINNREQESDIPEPPKPSSDRVRDASLTRESGRKEGKEGKEGNTRDADAAREVPPSPEAPEGFETFWAEWPSGGRKGGRPDCLKVWRKDKLESQASTIVAHVKAMKASREWLKDGGEYIPAPLVYLRGKRWDGAEIAGSSGMAPERAAMFQGAI
jgi:hypothetical protein